MQRELLGINYPFGHILRMGSTSKPFLFTKSSRFMFNWHMMCSRYNLWEKGSIGFLAGRIRVIWEEATLVCPFCAASLIVSTRSGFFCPFSVSSGMGLVSRGARVEFGCFVLHFFYYYYFPLLYVYG